MPQNGLIFACDKWEIAMSGSFSPATGVHPLGADLITAWTPDASTVSEGFHILWSKGHIVISMLGSTIASANGSSGSVTLLGLRLYAMPSTASWLLKWTGIEVRVNGAVVNTLGASSLSSSFIAPSGVPLIGLPPVLASHAGAVETASSEPFSCWITPFDVTDATSVTVTGGFRFYQDGAWHSMPVAFPALPNPAPGVPMPSVSGANTSSVTIVVTGQAHSTFDGVTARVQSHDQNAAVHIVPSVPTGIHRMNGDFAAMIKRYGLPATLSHAEYTVNGSVSTADLTVTPERSAFLEIIRSAPGLIEDALIAVPCPVLLEGYRTDATAVCPNQAAGTQATWTGTWEHLAQSYPNVTGGSPIAGYLNHSSGDQKITFWNRVAHPLWSYALQREDWPIDGSPVSKVLYWDRIGEQWLTNPALPAAQQSKTRTTLLSEPLSVSPWGAWLDSFFAGERWLGISRYKQVPAAPPATVTAGETGWSFTGCAGAWSAGVLTLTPFAGSFSADYDLGQWADPWQFPHVCSEIWTAWSGSSEVYLIGTDGSEVLLSDVTGQWKLRPVGSTTKFAGSWAVDQGCGVVSDQGVDTGTSGISSATVSDAEKSMAFGLLPGFTARLLRFKFSGSTARTVQKPQFRWTTPAWLHAESRLSQIGLWASGPGVRVGQWDWSSSLVSPAVRTPGGVASTLDALCTRRALFEGRSPTTGLRTEILALWDSVELGLGASPTDAEVYASAVPASLSFWMAGGPDSVLVNAAAEVPPLLLFPQFRRGGYTCEVDMYAQEPRYVVSVAGSSPTQLGSPDWLSTTTSPSGWEVRQHLHPFTGSEADFRLRRGGTEFAHAIRPWRNLLWVGPAPSAGGSGLDHVIGPLGATNLVFVQDGAIQFRGTTYREAGPLDIVSTLGSGSAPRVFQDKYLRAWVSFESAGSIQVCFSDDNGLTWSTPTTMISNASHPRHFPGFDGSLFWTGFRYLGGASGPGHLIGRYQAEGDATPSAEFVLASASGPLVVRDDTFSIALGTDGASLWTLYCVLDGESGPSGWTSSDFGRTWTRVP